MASSSSAVSSGTEASGAASSRPSFEFGGVSFNPEGWGPIGLPTQYESMPFASFNKSDKVGKCTDLAYYLRSSGFRKCLHACLGLEEAFLGFDYNGLALHMFLCLRNTKWGPLARICALVIVIPCRTIRAW
jgi:hypothetical protein